MAKNEMARPEMTGHKWNGGEATVCAQEYNTPEQSLSIESSCRVLYQRTAKGLLVTLLSAIFELSPIVSHALGHMVLVCWPGFREA